MEFPYGVWLPTHSVYTEFLLLIIQVQFSALLMPKKILADNTLIVEKNRLGVLFFLSLAILKLLSPRCLKIGRYFVGDDVYELVCEGCSA